MRVFHFILIPPSHLKRRFFSTVSRAASWFLLTRGRLRASYCTRRAPTEAAFTSTKAVDATPRVARACATPAGVVRSMGAFFSIVKRLLTHGSPSYGASAFVVRAASTGYEIEIGRAGGRENHLG